MSEREPKPWLWWVDASPTGMGVLGGRAFGGPLLAPQFSKPPHLVILRFVYAFEVCILCPTPSLTDVEVATLCGLSYTEGSVNLGAAAGPAFVLTERRGAFIAGAANVPSRYHPIREDTPGAAVQVSLGVGGRYLAFVGTLAGNLNPVQSFFGAFVGVRAGYLRNTP